MPLLQIVFQLHKYLDDLKQFINTFRSKEDV